MRDATVREEKIRDLMPLELDVVSGGNWIIPVLENKSDGQGGEYTIVHWVVV
jgi:hypothetical protein